MKSTSHRSCSAVSPSPWVHEASESFVSRSVLQWRLWSGAKMAPKQFECIHCQTTVQYLLVLCELEESTSFKPPAKVRNLHLLSSISFPSSKKMYWSNLKHDDCCLLKGNAGKAISNCPRHHPPPTPEHCTNHEKRQHSAFVKGSRGMLMRTANRCGWSFHFMFFHVVSSTEHIRRTYLICCLLPSFLGEGY